MRWALATGRYLAPMLRCWFLVSPDPGPREKSAALATSCRRLAPRSREEQCRCVIRRPRRDHVRAAARCRRPPALTRHVAALPCRPAAAQQGIRYPAGPPTVEEI